MISSKVHYWEPDMSVPVFPTMDHPLGRTPLRPSKPLPWSNVYVCSPLDCTVRVKNQREDDFKATAFPCDEIALYNWLASEDKARQFTAMQKAQELDSSVTDSLLEQIETPTVGLVDVEDRGDVGAEIKSPSEVAQLPGAHVRNPSEEIKASAAHIDNGTDKQEPTEAKIDETGKDEERMVIVDLFKLMLEDYKPTGSIAIVKVSYDLTTVPEVLDPRGFFEEVEALEE